MSDYHISVLLQETLEAMQVQQGKQYIDATLGGGGHMVEIIKRGGRVLGIDTDHDAIEFVKSKLKTENLQHTQDELTLVRGNFSNIRQIADANGFKTVSAILFDLGISSHQIDTGKRGFSFQQDAELDMRMDTSRETSAKDLVNKLSEKELADLFWNLGEERKAKIIAAHIVASREQKPIETTGQLAHIVEEANGLRGFVSPKLRATVNKRVFQALRIAVNDELQVIIQALPQALELLEKKGRIVVISFHSLEDRIVKDTFKDFEKQGLGSVVLKKPITPSLKEQNTNKRSRSAKLRIFEKN